MKSTGKLVGEGGKGVKFTVIGYVFCQHLLSIALDRAYAALALYAIKEHSICE